MALLMCPSTYDIRKWHLAVWPAALLESHFLPSQGHEHHNASLCAVSPLHLQPAHL